MNDRAGAPQAVGRHRPLGAIPIERLKPDQVFDIPRAPAGQRVAIDPKRGGYGAVTERKVVSSIAVVPCGTVVPCRSRAEL